MPAVFTVPAVFKAVDKVSAPMLRMQKNVKKFGMSSRASLQRTSLAFTRLNNRVKTVGRNFKKSLGSMGAAFAGFAAIGAIGKIIGVFADFEQANASLSSVMSTATQPELKALQKDALRLGAITAKTSTEVVGLQESLARLGFAAPDIVNMTESIIAGSIAMQGELSETAELTGAMIRTFDMVSSDAPDVIDQMTLATQKSALNFAKLQTALPIVGGAANAAGVPFTKLLALLGKLSDSGIDASSSSNALKRIFIESKAKGEDYEQILARIVKNSDQLTASVDEFGVRASVSSVILSKNIKNTQDLDLALQNAGGTAETAAKKQLNTLQGRITILGSAWEGWILSMESGNGTFATFLKTIVEVTTEVLSLFTGTAKMESKLSETEKTIRVLAERAIFFLKAIKWIIIAYASFRAIMLLTNGVLLAYNVIIGISAALSGTASIAVGQSTVALGAYKIMLALVTAAQWLWAAAVNVGLWPLLAIAAAIAAIIAVVVVIVKKWDEWGAALSILLGPLGMVISLIQSFRRNWDMIKQAFAEGGILAGFKAIGATILDAILMPLQQVMGLIAKIPGMGNVMQPLIAKMENFRKGLGVNMDGNNVTNKTSNLIQYEGQGPVRYDPKTEPVQQNNSIVDIFLNNRSGSDTEIFTEGTGVNVAMTGS